MHDRGSSQVAYVKAYFKQVYNCTKAGNRPIDNETTAYFELHISVAQILINCTLIIICSGLCLYGTRFSTVTYTNSFSPISLQTNLQNCCYAARNAI